MALYGLSFDHIVVEDGGKRVQAQKFVPITVEQGRGIETVKEIPQANAGDFIYLDAYFMWLKCIGDNLWRYATKEEAMEAKKKAKA